MKELMLDASVENIPVVTDFVDEQLKEYGCPMEVRRQIHIAIDELFGNIAHYAYQPDVGPAVVRMEVTEDPLTAVLTFTDRGVPYNPLKASGPDTTLLAEERPAGGLGIYMVKKSMDEVTYEYRGGKYILKIKKRM